MIIWIIAARVSAVTDPCGAPIRRAIETCRVGYFTGGRPKQCAVEELRAFEQHAQLRLAHLRRLAPTPQGSQAVAESRAGRGPSAEWYRVNADTCRLFPASSPHRLLRHTSVTKHPAAETVGYLAVPGRQRRTRTAGRTCTKHGLLVLL
jgi:hypothetical protein